MSRVVVSAAPPARLGGVPLSEIADHPGVIVNLLGGSALGAWLGATWATRMAAGTLDRVLAALLVVIAAALAANHVGTLPTADPPLAVQIPAGVLAGAGIGVVAAVMGVAGGELLVPTVVLLYAVDIKLAGSLSLAVSLPTTSPSPASARRAASLAQRHRPFVSTVMVSAA